MGTGGRGQEGGTVRTSLSQGQGAGCLSGGRLAATKRRRLSLRGSVMIPIGEELRPRARSARRPPLLLAPPRADADLLLLPTAQPWPTHPITTRTPTTFLLLPIAPLPTTSTTPPSRLSQPLSPRRPSAPAGTCGLLRMVLRRELQVQAARLDRGNGARCRRSRVPRMRSRRETTTRTTPASRGRDLQQRSRRRVRGVVGRVRYAAS